MVSCDFFLIHPLHASKDRSCSLFYTL